MQTKQRKRWIPLASLALLTGCATTPPPAPIAVNDLCKSWTHKRIKAADKLTEETAQMLEGDNKARPAWGCEYGANRAKANG